MSKYGKDLQREWLGTIHQYNPNKRVTQQATLYLDMLADNDVWKQNKGDINTFINENKIETIKNKPIN